MRKAETDSQSIRSTSSSSDIALQAHAPLADWDALADSDHFVQFYEADDYLLDSLGGFIGTGLETDYACIVVATSEHRAGLEARLHARGLDVVAAAASGQYVSLDAAETLAQFMLGDAPDPARFTTIIENIIAQAAAGQRRVRIFGEMVALLSGAGNYAGAIQLEELWNQLGTRHPFTLFCAYPMSGFTGAAHGESLGRVCAGHARVIPAESYTGLTEPDARLRAITQLQQKARALEAEVAERQQTEAALRAVQQQMQRELAERAQLLSREQSARAEAESANRLKDEFLATVSHELRTPLNAIMGWTHMLRSGRLDETAAERALETIDRNAQAQAQLVEDILDVSRMITGKLRLKIGRVDMASVINAAIDSVQLAADAKDIQLAVTLEPSARHIQGDTGRLQQVVWNLLSNAIKFTPIGGRVEVSLKRAGTSVEICVRDSGEGIKPEFLPYIFDRFRQADSTSTRRHGGLGLGLAIVRHLIEQHGGTVEAESPGADCGATFTIRLPLGAGNERAPRGSTIDEDLTPMSPHVN
ncbi:MAG TPA: ATP-binding protein [Pyrinomonadaceae bacterium]